MADLPRPKKNNRTVNTDDEETVVIKVDEVQYEKQNLDNVNTAKIPVSQQNSYRQNGNNYGDNYNQQAPRYTGPRAASNNRGGGQHRPQAPSYHQGRPSQPQNRRPNNNQGMPRQQAGRQQSNRQNGSQQYYGNGQNRNGYNNNYNNGYNNGYSQRPPQRQAPPPRQQQSRPAPRRRRRGGIGSRILKTILFLVVAIFIVYSIIVLLCIARMNRVDSGQRSRTAGAMTSSSVTNVLVIGTDSRDPSQENGRSDSMILVSLNSKTHKMYMSSFMRDAYVDIPGYGSAKLNAAYSYGGADLLMDTIEANYNVKIDSYVSVTFKGFAGIIDSVGGVKITLSDDEANALNVILQSEVNEIMGDDVNDDLLSGGGTYKLDGKQALSYSRIRYTGNADFERTERQRTVMNQVFKKIKSLNPAYIGSLFSKSVPQLTTNMSASDLYLLSLRLPTLLIYSTQQQQIPADGTWSNGSADGQDVLKVDFDANQKILADTVFAG